MGFLKKITRPISRVLDKIVPNEIKPALPFLAAAAPFMAPGIMGIGVDTNQNWMHPGNMLTSMLKRLDLTIFEQAQKTEAGTFESGIHILGLAEGMVGYATEDGMVTSEMASAVEAAAAEIVSGSMEVADWSQE